MIKVAILAGGCFWGLEELFRTIPGVISTEVGYTGGSNENPTYENHPGHAEALKIEYDDTNMTIEDIASLDVENIKDAYIKVIVKNRTNPYIYDLFLNRLTDSGATDVKSIEDSLNLEDAGVDEILDETKDTKETKSTLTFGK